MMAELETNWFLLILIFSVCVLVKVLQHVSSSFSDKVSWQEGFQIHKNVM